MSHSLFCPRRLLWVDAQPATLVHAQRFLQVQHQMALRLVDSFEAALETIPIWRPHLLLLDYTVPTSTMPYENFVHAQLPLVDPYRPRGPLADNPWQYATIPILLVAGEPLISVPGLVVPHLTRVHHFLPKPCDPCYLVQLVLKLLPDPDRSVIIDPNRGQIQIHGISRLVTPRRMDLLATLASCHPQPLTAAELVRHMAQDRGVHTSETSVRTMVSTLRKTLVFDPDRGPLVGNDGQGYYLTYVPTLME